MSSRPDRPHIAIIGAGIGGLSAALRLSHTGAQVTVFERHTTPGGKMRALPSVAGPVDAGPTVLTMRDVFDDLFETTGSALENHLTLTKEATLARHFWPDGTQLDLMTDPAASTRNIADTFGPEAAAQFATFNTRTNALFDAFDAPMMRAAQPSIASLTAHVLRNPHLIGAMQPLATLAQSLSHQFSDPKLAQLFGRYATYVGGIPDASPALLSLIWQAEAQGVWHVRGGMHALACAIAERATQLGARFHYSAPVQQIHCTNGRPTAVQTAQGTHPADAVLFNGDLRALQRGLLGPEVKAAVAKSGTTPRSLSAVVLSFAATLTGPPLAAHNVFFCDDPATEFGPLSQGKQPRDATLYICAQDRFDGQHPTGPERFEIILNAPPAPDGSAHSPQEKHTCLAQIMQHLHRFGLQFSPEPTIKDMTSPSEFAQLFPASNGSLYGRSPHGMRAAFQRPTVRSRMKGLYLVGGGVHPGAGVPMATLSARHAAEAIAKDLSLTSMSRPVDTPGGTSTVSRTMAPAPSPSSPS